MPRHTVRVYTDYKSPYGYLANVDIFALEAAHDVALDWYPYILPIADYLGSVESRNAHQWRRVKYSYMDARRLANEQGLTLYGPKRVFNGYYSSAGLLFAKANGFFRPYHDLVFERFFKRELDIDSLEQMTAAVECAGGSGRDFADYAEGPGRQAVKAVIDEAEAMGVFGVPTLVFKDELFWGRERIPMVIQRIESASSD